MSAELAHVDLVLPADAAEVLRRVKIRYVPPASALAESNWTTSLELNGRSWFATDSTTPHAALGDLADEIEDHPDGNR